MQIKRLLIAASVVTAFGCVGYMLAEPANAQPQPSQFTRRGTAPAIASKTFAINDNANLPIGWAYEVGTGDKTRCIITMNNHPGLGIVPGPC